MSDPIRNASPDNNSAETEVDPALWDRRVFMKRLMIGSGAAAFAAMGAATVQADQARAADPSPSPSDSAPPSTTPTGPPPGGPGGGGGPGAQVVTDDFFGLTTDGYKIDGLYAVHSTGVSTDKIVAAATAFLASLDDTQKAATQFGVHSLEWRQWSNIDNYARNGVELGQLSDAQKQAGLAMVRSALSARGITLTDTIRRINGVAGRLIGSTVTFNEEYYFFTIMGTPSATQPWGFQFEGHHLALNYFVLGDQVVMTPSFLGSEPTSLTDDQTGAPLLIFDDYFAAALATINALSPANQALAILSPNKTGGNNVAEAFRDNVAVPYAGAAAGGFSHTEKQALLTLVQLFLTINDTGQAAIKLAEITKHLDDTHFAWVGATTAEAVFWFRIHSPVIYIEFECATPGPLGRIYGGSGPGGAPTRQHVHCVIRTPNGNDYGKELLRMHYATSPHHQH